MNQRFIFPAVAITTAWAQQPSPAAAEAEAAVRARVQQFYQLQLEKKFRQAETFVADDTKDAYYNSGKPDLKSFEIQKIELKDNNTHALVTLKRKLVIRSSMIGAQTFDMPLFSSWKVENGQWVWYIDPELASQSPFGQIRKSSPGTATGTPPPPIAGRMNVADLKKLVTFDPGSVTLSAANPDQAVTFTNGMPGPVTLKITRSELTGISVELEKSELKAGETSQLRFHRGAPGKNSGTVYVLASPLNNIFEVPVESN
jgi:hypothetical protein